MSVTSLDHRLLAALWNLRWLGLFLLGPALGVGLVCDIFGMNARLLLLAGGMLGFTLGLFGLLVAGEYRRLRNAPPQA